MMTALIGMGGNVGAPRRNLTEALEHIRRWCPVIKVSSLYRTAAVGGPPGQPDCRNAVIEIEAPGAPMETLEKLHEIEKLMGRERREKWGPRVIDLDLLDQDGMVIERDGLTLPHPLMHKRSFVLAPLREIMPDWKHPVLGITAAELYNDLPTEEKSVILQVSRWP